MPKSLEERVRLIEDERELRDLLARYSFNADLGRTREYADMYTNDAGLDLRDLGMDEYSGRESIFEDFITQPAAAAAAGRTFHQQSPTVFHIDGDDATGEGYSIVLYADESGTISFAGATNNRWTFRREDNGWKIAHRVVRVIGSPEASEIYRKTTR